MSAPCTPSNSRSALAREHAACEFWRPSENRAVQPCRFEGCTFRASRRVVIAHFHAAHGKFAGSGFKSIAVEGQRFRVLLGTDPREVEQWRAERRKRWPSAANVARRDADDRSRCERGALPRDARGGRGGRGRSAARGATSRDGRGRCRDEALAVTNARLATVPAHSKRAAPTVADEDPPGKRLRPDGSALGLLLSAYDDGGGDGLSDHENVGDAPASGPSADAALEEDEPDALPGIVTGSDTAETADGVPPQGSRVCSYFLHRGNCVHGDECAFSHDVAHVPLCRFYAAGRCRQGQRCHFAHRRELSARRRTESSPRPPAPSLLRKLLENEIRQEHTVILQCFRWLVENEFLQTPTTSRAGASCAPCIAP